MRTRAHFVGRLEHFAIAFRQGVQDNQVQVDFFLPVTIHRRQAVGAGVAVLGMMDHQCCS